MIGPFTAPADGVGARGGPLRRRRCATGTGRRSGCAWRPTAGGRRRAGGGQGGDHRADAAARPRPSCSPRRSAGASCWRRSTTPAELVADEHLRERGYWEDVDGRTCPGAVRAVVGAGRCRRSARRPRSAAAHRRWPRRRRAGAGRRRRPAATRLPLAGLKVVDLTWVFAGRWRRGCWPTSAPPSSRSRGPATPTPSRGGGGALQRRPRRSRAASPFAHFNCGKLGLSLDLTNETARDVLRDLVRWADVLVESFTPGVMDGLGPRLRGAAAINPRLVMMSTSLMGQTGPLSTFAGFGNLAGAITGFYELTGWPDRAPAGPFLAYTDYVAPKYTRGRRSSPRSTGAAGPAAGSTSTSPRPRRRSTSSPRPSSTTPSTAPTRRAMGNADPFLHPHGVYPLRRRRQLGGDRLRGPTSSARALAGDGRRRSTTRRSRRGRATASRPTSSRRCRPSASRPTACRTAHACWADPQLRPPQPLPDRRPPRARHVRRRGPAGRAVAHARASCAGPARRWASTTTSCCATSSATTTTASPTSSSPAPSADPEPSVGTGPIGPVPDDGTAQAPFHCGGRFSANARGPSM